MTQIHNHNQKQEQSKLQLQQETILKQLQDTFLNHYSQKIKQKLFQQYTSIIQQNQLLEQIKDQIVKRRFMSEEDSKEQNNIVINSKASLQKLSLKNRNQNKSLKNVTNYRSNQNLNLKQKSVSIKTINQQENNKLINLNFQSQEQQQQKSVNSDNFIGIKSKFSQQIEKSIIQTALQQVKSTCSQQNYQILKTACQNNKFQQYLQLKKTVQRLKKQNQQILASNINQHKDKSNLIWQINMLKPKVKAIQEQKIKIKKQMDQLLDKESKLFKIQASFAFKQKISLQGRKRYERQRQSALKAMQKMEEANKQFMKLWDMIQQKCSENNKCCNQSNGSTSNCWKKDIMRSCKQKILQQRNILKAQQQQIQKQYEIMSNLSGQFKKLFALNNTNKTNN